MAIIVTGDKGAGKTNFVVTQILYPAWLSGVDICSTTLLFFETRKRRSGTNIVHDSQYFSWWEHQKWTLKKILKKIFDTLFVQELYNPQDPSFWIRNRKLLKKMFYEWIDWPYCRGNITLFGDLSEVLGRKNCIIFCDEVPNMDARDWEALPAEFRNSARQDRHNAVTLVLCTQQMGQVDKTYRRLIQEWIECSETNLGFGRDPVWIRQFRAEWLAVGSWTKSETASTAGLAIQREVLKVKNWWISIFARRKYDTNYNVGFATLKCVCLISFKNGSIKNQWCIVSRDRTQKEIEMKVKYYFTKPTAKKLSPERKYQT